MLRKISLVLLAIALVFGCSGHFKNIYKADKFEALYGNIVVLETRGKVEVQNKPADARPMEAIGIDLGNGTVIALTHASEIPKVVVVMGMFRMPQKVLSESYFIGDQEVELIGRHNDISLFRYESDAPPVAFGDSDKLAIGDKLYVPGFSLARGFNFKEGIVSMTEVDNSIYWPTCKDVMLMHTVPTNPGDSGSPLLALSNDSIAGSFKLVGIVNATIHRAQGINFAIKGNYVQKAIEIILAR